jgi:hypothetical protein
MTNLDLDAIRVRHAASAASRNCEAPGGWERDIRLTDDVSALLAEIDRLRTALTELAQYSDERSAAFDEGTGLAQFALAAIANTSRRATNQ